MQDILNKGRQRKTDKHIRVLTASIIRERVLPEQGVTTIGQLTASHCRTPSWQFRVAEWCT
jgi:hypothetical protein